MSKTFDAVKMMRDIREKISVETQGMNLAELKKYLAEKLKASKLKPLGR
jgi:hypothetical protein